ncbi:MAG: glycine/sarcosine/betaine reductase selenoprotein B family protein [Acidimicrobiales bacterium]|jgi:D-proline reductase (dithiol) PrdB
MGQPSANPHREPPVDYIPRITAQYAGLGYGEYRWLHSETEPAWAPVTKPLSESRVGLIASGGIYVEGQTAFHFKDDATYRAIPSDIATESLRATHFAYDLTDARTDINVVYPIDALRAMADDGEIGELGPNGYTLMGGIYSTRRVSEELVPALVQRCLDDELDVVLLVPV